MKQTVSINRNKHEYRQIAINMKQADSINNETCKTDQLIAINMKQTVSINRNKHETDSFN